MSNRRKLKNEKKRRVRCPKCNGKDFSPKIENDRTVYICDSCGSIFRPVSGVIERG